MKPLSPPTIKVLTKMKNGQRLKHIQGSVYQIGNYKTNGILANALKYEGLIVKDGDGWKISEKGLRVIKTGMI